MGGWREKNPTIDKKKPPHRKELVGGDSDVDEALKGEGLGSFKSF